MISSNSVTQAKTKQHAIRNERGQFAANVSTPLTRVRQANANADLKNWCWLNEHGYNDVDPADIFAGSDQPCELSLMDRDLTNLRLTDSDWEKPFERLSDVQLDKLEAERPGENFYTYPFLY